jgi:ATP phosphoribosyltransferase regulatory subunit
MTTNWMLPEHISDVLPYEAQIVESMRRTILDLLSRDGYEYVIPPLIEYTNTLNLGTQEDLAKKIFKWLDTHSQKMLGVRADMTPQIARIDAHILNTENTTRFCYCDSVLHSRTGAYETRQPIQIGAEIYGTKDLRAEVEILNLMLQTLKTIGLDQLNRSMTLSVSHAALLNALGIKMPKMDAKDNIDNLSNSNSAEEQLKNEALYQAIKHKNYAFLKDFENLKLNHENKERQENQENQENQESQKFSKNNKAYAHQPFLMQLLKSHQIDSILKLMHDYAAEHNLIELTKIALDFKNLADAFEKIKKKLGFNVPLHFFVDVSDVESYQYHTGLAFSFYLEGYPYTIAKGGRYDAMSQAFGKNRPACGFSMNLRQLSNIYLKYSQVDLNYQKPIVIAPWLNTNDRANDYISAIDQTLDQDADLIDLRIDVLKKINLAPDLINHVSVMRADVDLSIFQEIEKRMQAIIVTLNLKETMQKDLPIYNIRAAIEALTLPASNFDPQKSKTVHQSALDQFADLQKIIEQNLKINHMQSFKRAGILGFQGLYLI